MKQKRLRDLGITIGKYPTGEFNAITDVAGIKVGHSTIIRGYAGDGQPNEEMVRTGVTAIIPNSNIFNNKLIANSFVLNGAGEISGLTQVNEWGLLETPIMLTNTMSVGAVSSGVVQWMAKRFEKIWNQRQVIIPVVGECDDSFLNDSVGLHIDEKNVLEAIKKACSGIVPEGCIGAGTGMICCDLKAGIGTSSRIVQIGDKDYTIGILVLSNFGIMEDLRVDGFPVGKIISQSQGNYNRRIDNYGSIITILATDLPVSPSQINRLCKRSALGIGRVGSYASHGSGEIILGFSTANIVKHGNRNSISKMKVIADEHINAAYQATIEATEEAILNSLTMATDMNGVDNHFVPAINLKYLQDIMARYRSLY